MVVAYFTRSKATPRLRRGSRRVSLSPPLLALPPRTRTSARVTPSAALANVEISLAVSRVCDDDSVSDPPSTAGRRFALPLPCRGRSRTDIAEVRRRLVDHLAIVAPPEVFANDTDHAPAAPGVETARDPEDIPVNGAHRDADGDPPNHELTSPPSPVFSVMSDDSIMTLMDQSRSTAEGRRSWAHYDLTSRFMNRLPPYFQEHI